MSPPRGVQSKTEHGWWWCWVCWVPARPGPAQHSPALPRSGNCMYSHCQHSGLGWVSNYGCPRTSAQLQLSLTAQPSSPLTSWTPINTGLYYFYLREKSSKTVKMLEGKNLPDSQWPLELWWSVWCLPGLGSTDSSQG